MLKGNTRLIWVSIVFRWLSLSETWLSGERSFRCDQLLLLELKLRREMLLSDWGEVCKASVACFFGRSIRDSEATYWLLIAVHMWLHKAISNDVYLVWWAFHDSDHAFLFRWLIWIISNHLQVHSWILSHLFGGCLKECIVVRARGIVVERESGCCLQLMA